MIFSYPTQKENEMKVIKTFWKILVIIALIVIITPLGSSKAAPPESNHHRVMNAAESGKVCRSKWTGRWIITYHSSTPGHYVQVCQLYVPSFIDNEHDAQNWRWSPGYIADHCSLPDEPQTWQGTFISVRKEMIKDCTWSTPVPTPVPT